MPTVKFPVEHFTRNVRRCYQNPDTALIREFLQNSVDAGATEISFEVASDFMIVTDNGQGMDRDVLENALLTMSGTHKGHGAIGGFGSAKEILLFQHKCYSVRTRDLEVNGCNLEYNISDGLDFVGGTKIKIVFHEHYKFEEMPFLEKAGEYLARCEVKGVDIFLNGKKVVCNTRAGKLFKSLDWCDIHVGNTPCEYASVRIGGVEMFRPYVSGSSKQVVINVTRPSTDILTVSRDAFTWHFADELQSVVNEIVVNKKTFGLMKDRTEKFSGSYSFEKVMSKIERSFGVDALPKETVNLIAARVRSGDLGAVSDLINSVYPDSTSARFVEDCLSGCDFYVSCQKNLNRIPKHLDPHHMNDRKVTIAKLWKRCIRLVCLHNNLDINFAVGWVLSDDVDALYDTVDGVSVFYLNPEVEWLKSSNHRGVWMQMMMTAAHEVAHYFYKSHNEDFMVKYDSLLLKANLAVRSWWDEYVDAKANEII
jgi:hypothetical protein